MDRLRLLFALCRAVATPTERRVAYASLHEALLGYDADGHSYWHFRAAQRLYRHQGTPRRRRGRPSLASLAERAAASAAASAAATFAAGRLSPFNLAAQGGGSGGSGGSGGRERGAPLEDIPDFYPHGGEWTLICASAGHVAELAVVLAKCCCS